MKSTFPESQLASRQEPRRQTRRKRPQHDLNRPSRCERKNVNKVFSKNCAQSFINEILHHVLHVMEENESFKHKWHADESDLSKKNVAAVDVAPVMAIKLAKESSRDDIVSAISHDLFKLAYCHVSETVSSL
jgi:hypothetical protein